MTNGALLRSRLGLHGGARAVPAAAAPLNCALLDITGAASNQHQAKNTVWEGDWEKQHSQGPSSSDAAPLLPVCAIHASSFGKVEDEGPTWDLLGDLAATQHQQCQPQQHQQHKAHEQQAPTAQDQQPAASGVVAAPRFGRPDAEQHSCSATPGAPPQPLAEETDASMTDWRQPHATSIGRGRTDGSGSSGKRPGTLPTTRRKRLRSIFAEEEQQQQALAEGGSLLAGAAGGSLTPAGALEGSTAANDADLYAPLSSAGRSNGKGKPPPGAQPEQQAAGVTARMASAKPHGNPFARTGAAAKGSRITLAANTTALQPPSAAAAEAAGAVARFAGLPWGGSVAAAGKPGQQQQHIQPQQQQQPRNPFKPQQLDPMQQQRLARAEAALASSSSDDDDEFQLGSGGTFHPLTGCHPPTSQQQEQQAQQKELQGRQQQLQQHSRLQVRPQAKAGAGTVLQRRQEAEVVDLIGGDVVKAEPLLQPANQEHHQAPPPQIGGQQCAAQDSAAGQHQQAAWEADPGWSAQQNGAEAALAGPAQPFWQAAGDDWQEPQQRQQQSHEPWQRGGKQQQWPPPNQQQQQQQQQHWQAQEHQQQHQQQQPQLFWQAPDYEEGLDEVGEPGYAAGAGAGGKNGVEPHAQHWAGDQQGAAGGSAEWQQAQHAGGGLAHQAGGAGGGAGGDAPWWTRFPDFVPVAALHGGTDPRDGAAVYVNYRQQFTGVTSGGATTASRAVAGRGPFEAVGGGRTSGGKRQRNGGGGGQGGGRGSSGQGGAGSGGGGKTGYWLAEGGKNVYIDARGQKLWGQMAYRTAKKEQGEPLTAKGGSGRKRKAASAAGTPRRKGKKGGKAAGGGKRGKK
ncbi:hypothetical protein D9Q98_007276 [Chlorella vulgaris]|uniref:Uncharacterized protein n=1 Tax=Chlorella vulgaris TaxID=3077 RepID=A0A9D4TL51_CHLVU|nr:hypothetical protein D9Q98_007276 [Chlorella vulgaris]